MSEKKLDHISVNVMEKLIVNFAIPSDFVHWTIRSKITNEYADQSMSQRLSGIWHGKIYKYRKLIYIKGVYDGTIPPKIREVCRQTACGSVRLFLAENFRSGKA